eukprot:tig00021246_g19603.t1
MRSIENWIQFIANPLQSILLILMLMRNANYQKERVSTGVLVVNMLTTAILAVNQMRSIRAIYNFTCGGWVEERRRKKEAKKRAAARLAWKAAAGSATAEKGGAARPPAALQEQVAHAQRHKRHWDGGAGVGGHGGVHVPAPREGDTDVAGHGNSKLKASAWRARPRSNSLQAAPIALVSDADDALRLAASPAREAAAIPRSRRGSFAKAVSPIISALTHRRSSRVSAASASESEALVPAVDRVPHFDL